MIRCFRQKQKFSLNIIVSYCHNNNFQTRTQVSLTINQSTGWTSQHKKFRLKAAA